MTKTTLTLLALLLVTATAPIATPAAVLGPACTTDKVSDPCQFTCPAGYQIYVIVHEAGIGSADCGGAHAFCSQGGVCIASSPDGVAQSQAIGTCTLMSDNPPGRIICAAIPPAPLTKGCVAYNNVVCIYRCERYDYIVMEGFGSSYCGGVGFQCLTDTCDADVTVPFARAGVMTQQVYFDDVGYCYSGGDHFTCAAVTDPYHVVFE